MNTTSTRQKVGFALAGLLNASSIPSIFVPTAEGEVGPPFGIMVLSTVLGVVGLVAVLIAWIRSSGAAIRVAAGCLIINVLASLPAFFVDVPVVVKLAAAASVLVSIVAVVLMFSGVQRTAVAYEASAS